MSEHGGKVLEAARSYFLGEVRPRAEDIDLDSEALRRALRGLCERGLMALRRPQEYGGPALDEEEFRTFQELSAQASGSLSFLMTQHQSAVSMIAKSANEGLKRELLPKMANGERLLGIAFSQLRRPGPPLLAARPVDGGYELEGTIPWITGWTFFPEFIVGATLPSGAAVFGLMPFEDAKRGDAELRFSEPMKLAAMESALTVSARVTRWKLREEDTLFVRPADWAKTNDLINIVLQGHFALGCAMAGLHLVELAYEKKGSETLREAHSALMGEIEACRKAAFEAQEASGEVTTDRKLELRAWAIDLAVRCAHAAIAATGGQANSLRHPAQRIYREALVYTVSAQTPAIMEATLRRLMGRGKEAQ